jgi:hypothetical protein
MYTNAFEFISVERIKRKLRDLSDTSNELITSLKKQDKQDSANSAINRESRNYGTESSMNIITLEKKGSNENEQEEINRIYLIVTTSVSNQD